MVKYFFYAAVAGMLASCCAAAGADSCVMNDNYCDCGHDEPETSACSFYSTDMFLCKSTVFAGQKVPLSRVDDGICDCCDGSDESIPCDNSCAALEKLRVDAEEEERNRKEAGIFAQTKLKDEANALYEAKVAEGVVAKQAAADLVTKVENAKGDVNTATKAEYNENQLSIEDINTLSADFKTRFSAVMTRESLLLATLHGALQGGRSVVEALILSAESHLKPLGISIDTEKAVDALHSFTTLQESCQADDGSAADAESQFKTIAATLQNHLSLDQLQLDQLGEIAFSLYEQLSTGCDALFSRGADVKAAMDSACELRKNFEAKKAERMQPLEKLQTELAAARDALKVLEAELKSVKLKASEYDDIMKKDFGPDNLLFFFYKKCYEMSIDKYYYSICPFGAAKQDSTTLGKFDSLERLDNQIIFKFKYGDHCFATKRPRDLSLSMQCGREAKLVGISEPETCSYAAVLETPIAC